MNRNKQKPVKQIKSSKTKSSRESIITNGFLAAVAEKGKINYLAIRLCNLHRKRGLSDENCMTEETDNQSCFVALFIHHANHPPQTPLFT